MLNERGKERERTRRRQRGVGRSLGRAVAMRRQRERTERLIAGVERRREERWRSGGETGAQKRGRAYSLVQRVLVEARECPRRLGGRRPRGD